MHEIKLTNAQIFELYQLTKCAIQGNDDRDLYCAHMKLQKAYYMDRNEHWAKLEFNYDYKPPMYGQ